MADKNELDGLPSRRKVRALTIGAWANGGAAVLFLSLFLKYVTRPCIPLEKYEDVMNARINDVKQQAEQAAQARAAQVVLPEVRQVKQSIDTLKKGIDSLKVGV